MTTIDQLSTKSKSSQHNWVKRVIVEEEEIVVHIKFCEIEIIISQVKPTISAIFFCFQTAYFNDGFNFLNETLS